MNKRRVTQQAKRFHRAILRDSIQDITLWEIMEALRQTSDHWTRLHFEHDKPAPRDKLRLVKS